MEFSWYKSKLIKYIPILLTICSLVYVFNKLEIDLKKLSFNSNLDFLLAISFGLIIVGLQNFFMARRWHIITKFFGGKIPIRHLFYANSYSGFLNQFLPASIAGDAYRSYFQKVSGSSFYKGFSSVLVDRIIGLISLLIMACFFMLLVPITTIYHYFSIITLTLIVIVFFYLKIIFLKKISL